MEVATRPTLAQGRFPWPTERAIIPQWQPNEASNSRCRAAGHQAVSGGDSIGDRFRPKTGDLHAYHAVSPRFSCHRFAAGAVNVLGAQASLADEGPPETTTLRLARYPGICIAPGQIAEELLRARVHRYPVPDSPTAGDPVFSGEIDFSLETAAWVASNWMPASLSWRWRECIRLLRAVRARAHSKHPRPEGQAGWHSRAADQRAPAPRGDRSGGRARSPKGHRLGHHALRRLPATFTERKVDAFLGFPPQPQELRARKIGRVILNMTTDKPWSQYFCCIAFGNRAWVTIIRSLPSAICEPSSRLPTCAPPSRSASPECWSMAGSLIDTTTRCRR